MHDNADYGKSRIVATEYGRGYAAGYRKALSDAEAAVEALRQRGDSGDLAVALAALDKLNKEAP